MIYMSFYRMVVSIQLEFTMENFSLIKYVDTQSRFCILFSSNQFIKPIFDHAHIFRVWRRAARRGHGGRAPCRTFYGNFTLMPTTQHEAVRTKRVRVAY